MGSYSRLSVIEREEISRGLSQGLSLRAIARGLSRAPSTVTRELARNGWSRGRYRAHTAERSARRRRRRRTEPSQRGQIPEMISIEERPAEVADRTVPGHRESDLIIGQDKASAIGKPIERTTRTVILVPLKGQDAETVRKAFARQMRTLPSQMRLSLTHDRGKEMTQHRLFTCDTKIQVYFAHARVRGSVGPTRTPTV